MLNQTPYEVSKGIKPSVDHLQIFGCIASDLIHNTKLNVKSQKCIFVLYRTEIKGYKLYNPTIGVVIVSRNAIFNEGAK